MKRIIALLVAVALVAVAFVAVPAFAATKSVRTGPGIRFGTSKLSIKRGDTVKFNWTGGLPHNVRISKGPQRGTISRVKTKGSASHKFTRAGTYTIVCDVHQPTMKMTIKVS